jgi:hypothetical protein
MFKQLKVKDKIFKNLFPPAPLLEVIIIDKFSYIIIYDIKINKN